MSLRLICGPRSYLDATAVLRDDDPICVVDVPPAAHTDPRPGGNTANTLLLRWDVDADVAARTPDGSDATVPWSAIVHRMRSGAALTGLLGPAAATAVPLFVLVDAGADAVHVLARIRLRDRDALFVRVTSEPVAVDGAARHAAALVRQNALFLNNHQCYYRRLFDGEELEHKYRIDPAIDIWDVTVQLYNEVRDGALRGYVPEYGDEFQSWDYHNVLFEVPGPPAEQGYISFIALSTGGYTIKRKWFAEDAVRRGERHYKEPAEIPDLEAYLRKRFEVDVVAYPPFQRVRYDINFESLATGHVYGIFFDHSRLVDDPAVAMAQCELEYLRTRSVLAADPDVIWAELEQIAQWLEGFLVRHDVDTRRGVYSKLSFLRDNAGAVS